MNELNKLPTSLTTDDGILYYSIGTGINVRSGPNTESSVIGMINTLDEVVAVQSRYDSTDSTGMSWDKVKLGNGVVGYVASKYLKSCEVVDENVKIEENKDTEEAIATAIVKLSSGSLRIRQEPTSSAVKVSTVENGELVEILQKDIATADGFTWYKIRYNGIKGYVASAYLTNITNINNNSGENVDNSAIKAKISENNVVAIPNLTVKELASALEIVKYEITKDGKQVSETSKIGTGYVIKDLSNNTEKTIIVKGDVNGDGLVKSTDYMKIKSYIMDNTKLTDVELKAADVNNDNQIKATDYMKIKNYIMENISITIE
jgi:uncharacterized protein YraI